jgi:maltose/moltooligosaccharide transporter
MDCRPITGLLVQPIVDISDNTWSKSLVDENLIFYWCYSSFITLFIMPHSPVLWVAAGLLWILDSTKHQYGTVSCTGS